MKQFVLLAIIGILAWQGYEHYRRSADAINVAAEPVQAEILNDEPIRAKQAGSDAHFTCDGRTYCSEMKSCAEAEYFLKNCPGVKMDGDGDGTPCERQWCQ